MSRARLGYDFVAVPRRRHAGWVGLANGSGQFLFAPLFEIAEGAPFPFHGSDWRVWLCRVWCLAGKARSPVCKALTELEERGVIRVAGGVISVLFHPDAVHSAATTQPELATTQPDPSPNAGSRLGSSVGNNSTPKIQTDRQTRQTERESAREGSDDWIVGHAWFSATVLGGDSTQAPDPTKWRDDYAALGRKPRAEREAVAKTADEDDWVRANRRAVNPGHFVKHWGRYVSGGHKTVDRPASSAEVAAAGKQAAVASQTARLQKEFAESIRAAKAAGDDYTANRLAAERDLRLSRLQAQAS